MILCSKWSVPLCYGLGTVVAAVGPFQRSRTVLHLARGQELAEVHQQTGDV